MIAHLLNWFCLGFHTAWILAVTLAWISPATRRFHFVLAMATLLSWVVLGYWYGWGYCPFTDWHWAIRRQLGYSDRADSYIDFLIFQVTGVDLPDRTVDLLAVSVLPLSLAANLFLTRRESKTRASRAGS